MQTRLEYRNGFESFLELGLIRVKFEDLYFEFWSALEDLPESGPPVANEVIDDTVLTNYVRNATWGNPLYLPDYLYPNGRLGYKQVWIKMYFVCVGRNK